MPRGKPKQPKVSPLSRAELYELALGMPYRAQRSKEEIHKWLQEYKAEELEEAERLAKMRIPQYSGGMATNYLAVKAIIATVFLDNGSDVYLELEQGEDGVVNIVKQTLNRAPGTNDFYAENNAAHHATAQMLSLFTKGQS